MKDILRGAKIDLPAFLKNRFYDILAFILFGILTAAATFPLIFRINNCISGFFSTDEPSVWYVWWLKYAHIHRINPSYSDFITAPFGADLSVFGKLYPLWIEIKKLLAITFNEFFSYNFEIISGFMLSGFFVYLILRYLGAGRAASIFSGVIFAFCPYHFARAWQHIGLAHTEWMAFFVLSILKLRDKLNWKSIILAFLSLYLVFAFDLYYALFALVIAAIFVIYLLFFRNGLSLKFTFWLLLVSLANISILAINAFPLLKTDNSAGAWNLVRPFEDLFSQSARPLSYILPASVHPIFGEFTERFVGTKLYGMSFTEHTLYLGWTPLVLAFLAFRRRRLNKKLQITDKEDFYVGFFLFLAIVAWLFSQPPWWQFGPVKIFMPSFFMYKILPVFRAYCRFGIVLMLSVAVLAGFGLKHILEKFKTQKSKISIACLFSALVLFEFWNYPPYKVIDLSRVPEVYYWLKGEPGDFAIAEYPLDLDGPNESYKFHQTAHEKRIINATIPGTQANKVSQAIRNLSRPETSRILKWMGVKYVLVHQQGYFDTGLVDDSEELNKIPQNTGLKLIKSLPSQECPDKGIMCIQKTGRIDVYEVVASPLKP